MYKKAQGISMNVIIIAALALLVLVILSVIFMGRMGSWGTDVNSCENKGGKCFTVDCGTGTAAEYPTPYPSWKCSPDTEKCCVKVS